jgi:hypothetical protein
MGRWLCATKRGSGHCGAIQFEVDLDHGFEKLRRWLLRSRVRQPVLGLVRGRASFWDLLP